MLHRLFRTVSVSKDSDDNYTRLLLEPEAWCPIPLGESQIRVLFCQDAGDANKTILYDSNHGISATPIIPVNSKRTSTATRGGMARSWNGSDGFHSSKTASGRTNSLLGSLTDRSSSSSSNINNTRPSSMRGTPSSLHDNTRGSPSSLHRHHRQASRRLDLIGDMIFGTAPLAYKGMNTKVHYKRDKEPQIVISKLFTINPQDADVTRRTSFSSINSDWSTTSSIHNNSNNNNNVNTIGLEHFARRSTSTLSVRSISLDDNASELSTSDDDIKSHYSGYSAVYPPVLGLRNSSFNSKRSRRFSQTSMEDGIFRPMPMPGSSSIGADTNHQPEANNNGNNMPAVHSARTIKYALAVVITLDDINKTLFDFVFSHFSLIENHLHRLQGEAFDLLCDHFRASNLSNHPLHQNRRARGHLAYLESGIFQHDKIMVDAVMQFKRAFYDLYGIPRIQEPLWLNMSTFPQRKSDYSASLIKEFIYLIDEYDNDGHNYIISTLLSAVLMYHLSWVQTVAPPDEVRNINCRHGNYDPLWAQLSDLYGFVASPGRIARTIVVGQKSGLVRRILYILTYFIRCNEVYENVESMLCPDPDSSIFSVEQREKDTSDVSKLEDKIVKQLIGGSLTNPTSNNTITATTTNTTIGPSNSCATTNTGMNNSIASEHVESIAIPKTSFSIAHNHHHYHYNPPAAESPDSLNEHIISSSPSPSYSSRTSLVVNTASSVGGINNRWSTTSGESSFDPLTIKASMNITTPTTNDPSSPITDMNGYGKPQRQPSLDPVISANGIYPVVMPKSSIYRMTPDITQIREDGIPTDPAHHLFAKSYGRSLMGAYCDTYKSDFVLLGVSNNSFIDRLEADMKNTLPQFALTDEVTEAACLVIDTEKSRCRILRQHISHVDPNTMNNEGAEFNTNWKDISYCNIVRQLVTNIKQKHASSTSPDEIVDFIEDGLQLIYLQSLLLQERLFEWFDSAGTEPMEDLKDIAEDIRVEISDIPLLVNVCSTYDSRVAEILREAYVI
ncbi:folliculin-interacting protein middle domain-containing protein [Phascolomyces articulosus]|uniref:Folliculin-interacting protein middle domain-containing protein n=1 Tax=Phascolomyces articulosus TaxID=60185 RepID=A0AAD5PLC9_9FUNG|nr:folliculin-interacting protein middle domain-containing protein [Phascolomyces articulosus]